MNRMNRRDFLSVLGGASAVSVIGVSAFASSWFPESSGSQGNPYDPPAERHTPDDFH